MSYHLEFAAEDKTAARAHALKTIVAQPATLNAILAAIDAAPDSQPFFLKASGHESTALYKGGTVHSITLAAVPWVK